MEAAKFQFKTAWEISIFRTVLGFSNPSTTHSFGQRRSIIQWNTQQQLQCFHKNFETDRLILTLFIEEYIELDVTVKELRLLGPLVYEVLPNPVISDRS
jgi:hypothetical protein